MTELLTFACPKCGGSLTTRGGAVENRGGDWHRLYFDGVTILNGRVVPDVERVIAFCKCGGQVRIYRHADAPSFTRIPPSLVGSLSVDDWRRFQDSGHPNSGTNAQRGPGSRTEASGDSGEDAA